MRWQNVETPTFEGSAGSNGEPAVVETMQLVDRDGSEVAVITKAVDGVKSIDIGGSEVTATQLSNLVIYGNPTGVKVYRALLTQTGTDAPVATVLENTLGGTVVWTRSDVGLYIGTLAGAFTANKTCLPPVNASADLEAATTCVTSSLFRVDADIVKLQTALIDPIGDAINLTDTLLNNAYVEMLVNP